MDTFVPFYAKNMERLAELQKKSLDMAAEQSTELMDAWKRVFRYVPDTPGMFLFDLFGQMFERCVETQKGAIDMTVEQTHAMTDLAKERGGSMAKMTGGMTHLFQQSVEHSVAAQKKRWIIMRSSIRRPTRLPSGSSGCPTPPPKFSKAGWIL